MLALLTMLAPVRPLKKVSLLGMPETGEALCLVVLVEAAEATTRSVDERSVSLK